MNKTILIGRLTADPELRQTQSGTSTCSFTIACDRNAGKDKEKTADFIRCVAFGSRGEFVSKYFTKGKQIAVVGNLKTGSYKDKNHDDVTHYTMDVWVDEVEFVGGKSDGNSNAKSAQASAPVPQAAPVAPVDDSDVPF